MGKRLTQADVLDRIESSVKAAGTQSAFCAQVGISPSFLVDVLKGRRPPTGPLLVFLKLEKEQTCYVPRKATKDAA